jgi:hypothetical protein
MGLVFAVTRRQVEMRNEKQQITVFPNSVSLSSQLTLAALKLNVGLGLYRILQVHHFSQMLFFSEFLL